MYICVVYISMSYSLYMSYTCTYNYKCHTLINVNKTTGLKHYMYLPMPPNISSLSVITFGFINEVIPIGTI